ncbi:cytochrome c550 [Bacillus massiliigorillae]|uniref:cytochrome c550 n=1 Tax=Bacillus massiliigorillae TaxID=1243664 RepID=UPI0003A077B4|nr:cytochrome c [Bacillus massiliigorillae]
MKRSPIMPFVFIMVMGIGLMFFLSFKGLGDADKVANEGKEGEKGAKTEQTAGSPEEIYKSSCIGCHGSAYEGGVGPALKGITDKVSMDEIKDTLKNGRGAMPSGLVPDAKIDEMAKWLSELK